MRKTIHAGFYTGGKDVPSARFRARQYKSKLPDHGVVIHERPSFVGKYPPAKKWMRPLWLLTALGERAIHAPESYRFDVVVFQRELISTLMTLEPFFKGPKILDIDDAIWLHRGGGFCRKIATQVDAIICGNKYIAEHLRKYNSNIHILPTAVDSNHFLPLEKRELKKTLYIGWSGTYGNLKELEEIEPALQKVLSRFENSMVRVICDRPPRFKSIPNQRVEYVPWSREVEVSALQDLSVGLMPLQDTPWTRGKCAFKMLTYMSCGVPVVVSPVGMNADLVKNNDIGLPATSIDEWYTSITSLLENHEEARKMGERGRQVIATKYSVDVLAKNLASIIKSLL